MHLAQEYKYQDISDVCRMAIQLFPSQRKTPSEINGIVSIVMLTCLNTEYLNIKNKSLLQDHLYDGLRSGPVYNRLKNLKEDAPIPKKRKRANHPGIDQPNNEIPNEEVEELCTFLKQCTLPKDVSMVKDRMKDTADLRRDCLIRNKAIYNSSVHLYLADPHLVIYIIE